MKQRKLLPSLFLAAALAISLLTGCGNTGSSTSETKQTENSACLLYTSKFCFFYTDCPFSGINVLADTNIGFSRIWEKVKK